MADGRTLNAKQWIDFERGSPADDCSTSRPCKFSLVELDRAAGELDGEELLLAGRLHFMSTTVL